jgi:hypothetical protein
VRYPASFDELVKQLHKKPVSSGVGMEVEEMAYSSLYIHTHVTASMGGEGGAGGATASATTHIYAEDVSRRTRASTVGAPGRKGVLEEVASPVRTKPQRRRRRAPRPDA